MTEMHTYAVYFHPQALEVLGEPIAPYLTDGPGGTFADPDGRPEMRMSRGSGQTVDKLTTAKWFTPNRRA